MKKEDVCIRLEELHKICSEYYLLDISERIETQLKLIDEPLRIMIVGEGKSGKSSLLNALVGENVAEVDYEPKTWCIGVYASTKGEPYAEVVYKDSIRKTSIEEAKRLMHDYETAAETMTSMKEVVRSREIEEIRWYLNIGWPSEGVVIIDTPGFLQGREDTKVIETQIDGIEGVHFVASDGFEKYYSKSDLVLWCFEASDVGAVDVKEKLESVKNQKKSIYGIVTKLDRCDSDEEREEFFQRNNTHYNKYIKQCLRSQLPPIRKKDSDEKLQKKIRLRQDTVEGIKRCIDYLLNDTKASELKLKSYETFCANSERLVAGYLEKYINFYFSNMQIYENTKKQVCKELNSISSTAASRIKQILDGKAKTFLIGTEYKNLWYQCGEDPQKFGFVLKTQEENSGFLEQCNRIQKECNRSVADTISYHNNDLKWNILNIGTKQEDAPQTAVFHFDVEEKNLGSNGLSLNIQNNIFDEIWGLFDKGGLLYTIINEVLGVGEYRREKTFSRIRNSFTAELESIENQYTEQINEVAVDAAISYEKALKDLFLRINGIRILEVEDAILRIDEIMSEHSLYSESKPYIPYIKNEKLCFVRNEILLQLENFKQQIGAKEIVNHVKQYYIKKAFDTRFVQDEKIIRDAMARYNGTIAVDKEILCTPQFANDSNIIALLPNWKVINWGVNEARIKKAYDQVQHTYLEKREKLWLDYATKAIERVLSTYLKEWETIWTDPIKQFLERWKNQCEFTFQQCRSYRNYFVIPQEWDIKKYFSFDQMYHTNYATYFFMQFVENGSINQMMLPNVTIITPDGEDGNSEILKQIEKRLNDCVCITNSIVAESMSQWDKEVQTEMNQMLERLVLQFEEIRMQINNVLIREYLQYLISMNGSKHTKSVAAYITSCGKLSRVNMELMKGNVPVELLGNNTRYVLSNGVQIHENIKAYIEKCSEEILKRTEEKVSNERNNT